VLLSQVKHDGIYVHCSVYFIGVKVIRFQWDILLPSGYSLREKSQLAYKTSHWKNCSSK